MFKIAIIANDFTLDLSQILFHNFVNLNYETVIDFDFKKDINERLKYYNDHVIILFKNNNFQIITNNLIEEDKITNIILNFNQ
jgi:hypothetical protein